MQVSGWVPTSCITRSCCHLLLIIFAKNVICSTTSSNWRLSWQLTRCMDAWVLRVHDFMPDRWPLWQHTKVVRSWQTLASWPKARILMWIPRWNTSKYPLWRHFCFSNWYYVIFWWLGHIRRHWLSHDQHQRAWLCRGQEDRRRVQEIGQWAIQASGDRYRCGLRTDAPATEEKVRSLENRWGDTAAERGGERIGYEA